MNHAKVKQLRKELIKKLGRTPTNNEWRKFKKGLIVQTDFGVQKPVEAVLQPVSNVTSKIQTITHLIYTPFTGVGLYGGFKSQEWFDNRIDIFKKYTLQSLLNQNNKRFIHWISFRPEEYSNKSTLKLADYLKSLNYNFVFTFDGLMYYDDKFSPKLTKRILNFARIVRYAFRTKSPKKLLLLKEVLYNKNASLYDRLKKSLATLQKVLPKSDLVFMTRLDSDDLLHKEAIEKIQVTDIETDALILKKGYVYNANTKEIAEWNPTTTPPFYTIVFQPAFFFNAQAHLGVTKNYTTHEDISTLLSHKDIDERLYCVLVHGNQISTIWNHPFRGNILHNKEEITQVFNIK